MLALLSLLQACSPHVPPEPAPEKATDSGTPAGLHGVVFMALWRHKFGEPLPWIGTAEEKYHPSKFRRVLFSALEHCGAGLKLVDLECAEPPCIALVEFSTEQQLLPAFTQCKPWVSEYGDAVTVTSNPVQCPGIKAIGAVAPDITDELRERALAREKFLVDSWVCASR